MLNKGNGQLSKNASLPHARTTDLVTREMPDEILVYDLKRHKAHCLNQTAALVWKHCDGQRTIADIAGLIGNDLGTTVDERTVWLAVERLGKAHLLEERVNPPAGSPRLSRREAVRRLGLGAALAMPVVISIVAPTAVSAATCRVNGLGCSSNSQCCSGCCDVHQKPDQCSAVVAGATQLPGTPCDMNGDCCSNSCPSMTTCA